MRWLLIAVVMCGCGGEPTLTVRFDYPLPTYDEHHVFLPEQCFPCSVNVSMSAHEYRSLEYLYQHIDCVFTDLGGDKRYLDCSGMTCGIRLPGFRQGECGFQLAR